MSTVSKDIADRIIAGEFPEDNVTCIIQYNNIFNGDFAYKIITAYQDSPEYREQLLYFTDTMLYPTIYWEEE